MLTKAVHPDGSEHEYRYNENGKISEIINPLGIIVLRKVTDHNGKEVKYAYGAHGERTGITYPDGKAVTYRYDESLRLKTLVDGDNTIEYTYDAGSRLSGKVFSSRVSTKDTYNTMVSIARIVEEGGERIYDDAAKEKFLEVSAFYGEQLIKRYEGNWDWSGGEHPMCTVYNMKNLNNSVPVLYWVLKAWEKESAEEIVALYNDMVEQEKVGYYYKNKWIPR